MSIYGSKPRTISDNVIARLFIPNVKIEKIADPTPPISIDPNDVPSGAALIKGQNDPKVYFTDTNSIRWIASEAVFNKYCFNWDSIITVPDIVIQLLPKGNPISS
ncbi:MAG: hypothetical protein INR73_15250 [Williamsia sp.]|nr:hypothetical protein [Williamsia sp.]